ncbi:MAG: hypothetical protein KBS54_03085 [Synergistaceae bacterium]|nr:hypothetical protein [Candidatus Equadaptatus faecalis]
MMENFDALEKAIDEMGNFIDTLLAENTQLKSDINGLKNTLDDRNQEIAQLQQEIQSNSVKVNASIEAAETYEKRAGGLLARVRAMQQRKAAMEAEKASKIEAEEAPKAEDKLPEEDGFPKQLRLMDD